MIFLVLVNHLSWRTENIFSGQKVVFKDMSANSPTAWAWDFGDGGTSTSQNPTYIYEYPGTYDVSLTVTNDYGSHTLRKNDLIKIEVQPC